jgi:acyl-CoA dehydrogenase
MSLEAIAFDLPDELVQVREGLISFADQEILPRHDKHAALLEDPRKLFDERGALSADAQAIVREMRMVAAEAGYYAMCVPEELGGAGLGHLAYYVGWETLFHHCGPLHWLNLYAIAHWAFGPSRLLEKLSDRARGEILAPLMSGDKSMCFGLSEPGAGSDAAALTTRAVKDGQGWRITGRKIWTSNAPIADYCILFAVTDAEKAAARKGGITGFLVPTNAPGFEVQRIVKLFGHIGGDEAELRIEDLYVEPWQIVGELDQGFGAALYGVSLGRIYNSARSVGYGRWALELALDYANERQAFGNTIADYQAVSFPLAESAMELHGAHLMGLNAGLLLDQGHRAIKELSMTKAFSVQCGFRAVDRGIQAHGAMGFTNEVGLTEAWHALRIVNVADGTNEILMRTVSQRLRNGDTAL